jgi:hypothetical protein
VPYPNKKNCTGLIEHLLKTGELTTPILENYLGCKLHLKRRIQKNVRHYRLCLPDGSCVEAGQVRALTPEGAAILKARTPLGPWAVRNGFTCEKKNLTNIPLHDTSHPVARALGTTSENIIGRRYDFILKKNGTQIPLLIEEYWNCALF